MLLESSKHKTDCVSFEWKYVNYEPFLSISKYFNAGNSSYVAQCRRAETKDWFGRPVLYPCEECPFYEQAAYAAVRFSLFNDNNEQVMDREQEDISVFEAPLGTISYSQERILSFINTEVTSLPTITVLCIDCGDTMSHNLGSVLIAAKDWLDQMWYYDETIMESVDQFDSDLVNFMGTNAQAADLVGVISSDSTVTVAHRIGSASNGTTSLETAIDDIVIGTGSAIFDAINRAITMLSYSHGYGNQSIILMSNGNDDSSTLTKQEAIDAAVAAGIKVHSIAITGYQNDTSVMVDIASGTGGTYASCEKANDIRLAAEIIRGISHGGGYQILWRSGTSSGGVGQAKMVDSEGNESIAIFRPAVSTFNYENAPEKSPPA